VIVYVPKLTVPEINIDTESLGRSTREQLETAIRAEGSPDDAEFDETVDAEALHGRLLSIRLAKADGAALTKAVQRAAVVVDCSMHQAPRSHLFPYAVKM
jgi:hypothetical protein